MTLARFRTPILVAAALVAFLAAVPLFTSAAPPAVRWFSERTVAEVGRTRIIAFGVETAPEKDTVQECAVGDPTVLEVVVAPAVVKGGTTGYLRVRGLKPGETTVRVGDASITVKVMDPRVPSASRPSIVCPADGAVAWGTFAVGVEVDAEAGGPGATHVLRLSPGGQRIPKRVSGPIWGPTLRVLFDIDAATLEEGPLEMTPVVRRADGTEVSGETIVVTVLKPESGDAFAMEAEDQRDVKRPERFGTALINVAPDPKASGQEYVSEPGSDPAACFPFTVEKAGWYQAALVARGSFAGGAFPTVGLIVDAKDPSATNVRLVDENWHRVLLGVPVKLDKGDHVLTPYFLNDFYAGGVPADRNLFLDRFDIVRVDRPKTSGGEGSDPGGPMMAAPGGAPARDTWSAIRVAFADIPDGKSAAGMFEVNGVTWWRKMDKSAAPKVALLVNGTEVASQRSAAPKFWVDPAQLVEGENTLQLVATLEDGTAAKTPLQRVGWKAPWKDAAVRRPMPFLRFTMRDPAWDDVARKAITANGDCPEKLAAMFASNATATLTLPEHMSGPFQVFIEGKGDDYLGPPIAEVVLHAGKKETKVGSPNIGGWWSPFPAGGVLLEEGPKSLTVSFINDKYDEGKGDRNLAIQGVILLGGPPAADGRAPRVRVAWPPDKATVWQQDAIVLSPADDYGVAWIETEIDGKRTGVRADTLGKLGRFTLPLLARGLAAGEHTLVVVAADTAGHEGKSKERTFTVVAEAPESPGRYDRAVHLLNRFAWGPDPDELAAVLTMGEEAYLEDRLSRGPEDPGDATALAAAGITFAGENGEYDVMGRDAYHACASPNPVRTHFVRWVDNHFSTWIRKTGGRNEWQERRIFTRLGVAPFRDLLFASATSPCMLQYLDQQFSFARNLNENYAREICELQTAGVHGGYSQKDVTALANLFTGWMYANEGDGHKAGFADTWTFRFDPALSDARPERFFGMNFPKASPGERFDRARMAIELLAGHPSTATFVCSKLVAHYIAWPPPENVTADLAKVFLETDGDMKAVLLALAKHPAFFREGLKERVTTPFDHATRISRCVGFRVPWQVIDLCARSGAGIYDRPTPDGFQEEDTAWTSTNATLQRWKFARQNEWLLSTVVPNTFRWNNAPATEADRQWLIDLVAVRLTGRVLSQESNEAALEVLKGCKGNRNDLAMQAGSFVGQLPEVSLK
ncbi:MAG: DUF1800 family protein [Planctomycetes bacterium]|nr:DUF1800 family protein [Planctomycetota bacterium]